MTTPKNTEALELAKEIVRDWQGGGPHILAQAVIDLSNRVEDLEDANVELLDSHKYIGENQERLESELTTLREKFMEKEIALDACRNDLNALRASECQLLADNAVKAKALEYVVNELTGHQHTGSCTLCPIHYRAEQALSQSQPNSFLEERDRLIEALELARDALESAREGFEGCFAEAFAQSNLSKSIESSLSKLNALLSPTGESEGRE